ncbi:hypothetical protein GCM10027062_28960 [Nocardioides hungaricus]
MTHGAAPEQVVRLLVLWTHPEDKHAFEQDYRTRHLPHARAIPGLVWLRASTSSSPTYGRLAELAFTDRASLRSGLESAEGQRVAQDAKRLAQEHGVQSVSIVVEDAQKVYEGAWSDGSDLLATRGGAES